jgi:hypothetical protein
MARERAEPDERDDEVPAAARERKAFLLRLSPELFEELRRWAGQELRSLNSHIEYLLRDALRRRDDGRG